jgi:molecular chaperone GrpE (heat shock protein)
MNEPKESKRVRDVPTEEMKSFLTKLIQLNQRMTDSLEKLGETNTSIDGWDSVYRGAEIIRKQFSKIIGEANLKDIKFAVETEEPKALDVRAEQRKTKRNNKSS